MLFDIGWPELMLIGVIALVVIGPKDLPRAMRVAGYWIRKARSMSREFQNSIDQMIREAELDEMRDDLKKVTEFDIEGEFQKTVDPTGELAESIKPPELPDHFDEAPTTAEPAIEAAEAEQPELPLFSETEVSGTGVSETGVSETGVSGTGVSETGVFETGAAEPAAPPEDSPAPETPPDGAAEPPPDRSASVHATAPPKP
jgi:sec-independent protein translocase protein TatB